MDITLQRILSLIPKSEKGKYVHGAKKEFAVSIGYEDGDIISHWETGKSHSYMNKLYEIAANHNVSVEWLKGETDIKKADPNDGDGADETIAELIRIAKTGTTEERQQLLEIAKLIIKE